MTRRVDLEHRAEILDRITEYVIANGLGALSLRPVARAVGLAPRTLLYHFGSKEAMVAAVLERVRGRQRIAFDALRRSELHGPVEIARAALAYMTAEPMLPAMRLFFEIYALAIRDPQRVPGFFEGAVEDWLSFFSDPVCSGTTDPVRARTIATVLLCGYRGFMLDYVATGDGERVGAAMEAWAAALQSLVKQAGAA